MSREFHAVISLLFLFFFFLPGCTQGSPSDFVPISSDAVLMKMSETGFSPSKLSIRAGQTVVFENAGQREHWPASNIHPTHGIYPEFDSKSGVPPGGSWAFTFTKPGIWRCHDHLFPETACTVTVE